ncbi:MAG: hypothetical protein KC635_29925 [Myxococcales bacterium]|nr:hypothetical protein [Myxococcales bacterium]MCB9735218.1 hypothetical protein [Deltaproteobacteria bacterium]
MSDATETVIAAEAPPAKKTDVKLLRWTAFLLIIGLALEAIAVAALSPTTFVPFAFIGAPCILLGMLLYLVHVVRELKRTKAL